MFLSWNLCFLVHSGLRRQLLTNYSSFLKLAISIIFSPLKVPFGRYNFWEGGPYFQGRVRLLKFQRPSPSQNFWASKIPMKAIFSMRNPWRSLVSVSGLRNPARKPPEMDGAKTLLNDRINYRSLNRLACQVTASGWNQANREELAMLRSADRGDTWNEWRRRMIWWFLSCTP